MTSNRHVFKSLLFITLISPRIRMGRGSVQWIYRVYVKISEPDSLKMTQWKVA